jgi:hypothetical protein
MINRLRCRVCSCVALIVCVLINDQLIGLLLLVTYLYVLWSVRVKVKVIWCSADTYSYPCLDCRVETGATLHS